jgi:hypothetical protein
VWKPSIFQLTITILPLLEMMNLKQFHSGTGQMKKRKDLLLACNSNILKNFKTNTGSSSTQATHKSLLQTEKKEYFSYLGSLAYQLSNITHQGLRRKISVVKISLKLNSQKQFLFLTKRWQLPELDKVTY